jgi:hypothetical protein
LQEKVERVACEIRTFVVEGEPCHKLCALGPLLPHLHRDCAHRRHICTGIACIARRMGAASRTGAP